MATTHTPHQTTTRRADLIAVGTFVVRGFDDAALPILREVVEVHRTAFVTRLVFHGSASLAWAEYRNGVLVEVAA